MRSRSVLAAALACALSVVLAAGAPADAASKLDDARQRIRASQSDPLIGLLRQADDKRQAIEDAIARIESKVNDIQGQLDQLQPALDDAKRQRDMASQAVKAASDAYELSKRNLSINALSLYATGGWESAVTLFTTGDMDSYASAKVYLDTVVDSGARVVDGFHDSRNRLRAQQQLIESSTAAIVAKTEQLKSRQQQLIELSQSKQRESQDLTAALVARTQALSAIQNDPHGFDAVVRSYGSGTENLRMLIAAAQAGQPVQKPEAGVVWWPVIGKISSPYGWRIHPIFKYRSFHTGIDIAAPYGTAIRAAQPGTVVDVLYLGAFGMVTVVDHGFSLATMYAHQSRVLVHPGQHVQAGQIIGAVGCTGWCTGPHIHFEVWSQASPTNPLRWL